MAYPRMFSSSPTSRKVLVRLGLKIWALLCRTLLELEVPDEDLEEVGYAQMFRLVHDAPDEERERLTRDHGTRWLRERRSLGLVVPSAVMPVENNVLLNPDHPKISAVKELRLKEIRRQLITLDPRLLGPAG